MAWNKPSEAPKTAPKKSGALKGALAGIVVVAAIAAVFLFIFSGDEHQAPSAKHHAPGIIKEATPAPAPKAKVEEEKAEAPKPKPAPWRNKNLTPEQREAAYEKYLAEQKLPEASTNRLFRSGLEQVMGWIFRTEVGEMPPPLPDIPDFDYVHLQEILDYKNEVKDTDSETGAEAKQVVDYAKQELKKYLEKGGDPQEFLKFYHDELKTAYRERQLVQQEVMRVLREEPELADDYVKKVNESLAQKGIKGVVIPERIRRRVEAEQLEQLNQ